MPEHEIDYNKHFRIRCVFSFVLNNLCISSYIPNFEARKAFAKTNSGKITRNIFLEVHFCLFWSFEKPSRTSDIKENLKFWTFYSCFFLGHTQKVNDHVLFFPRLYILFLIKKVKFWQFITNENASKLFENVNKTNGFYFIPFHAVYENGRKAMVNFSNIFHENWEQVQVKILV